MIMLENWGTRAPYQMQDNAPQDCVDRKVYAALHALQSGEPKSLQYPLLKPAQHLSRVVAYQHMLLPLPVHSSWFQKRKLRSVEQN